LKQADRSGAHLAVIIGEDEIAQGSVTVRDLTNGEQQPLPYIEAIEVIRQRLAAGGQAVASGSEPGV
jgi:histidyl-tRNA synthetase